MISWAVVGHQARADHATTLAHLLDAPTLMDDGTLGADANHLRAWRALAHTETEWAGVAEDDAVLVPDFAEQVRAALTVAPTPIVSLYLGRSRPRRFQDRISRALVASQDRDACWITGTHMLHAVTITMRTELISDWLAWAPGSRLPIDERIGAWARGRGHKIGYTVPSLVDHRDEPTLVRHRDGHPRNEPRVAWRTGGRPRWTPGQVGL